MRCRYCDKEITKRIVGEEIPEDYRLYRRIVYHVDREYSYCYKAKPNGPMGLKFHDVPIFKDYKDKL